METDFRHVLREQTRLEHDQLDELISKLDIAQASGFLMFVQLHLSCFLAMQARLSSEARCGAELGRMVFGLQTDLETLSTPALANNVSLPARLDPLAIDYMVAGSRLGTKVLHKIWAGSMDATVQRASGYFGQISDGRLWRQTCQDLSGISAESPRARTVTSDVRVLFQFFVASFHALPANRDVFA